VNEFQIGAEYRDTSVFEKDMYGYKRWNSIGIEKKELLWINSKQLKEKGILRISKISKISKMISFLRKLGMYMKNQ